MTPQEALKNLLDVLPEGMTGITYRQKQALDEARECLKRFESIPVKGVWLNIQTGAFSNSFEPPSDAVIDECVASTKQSGHHTWKFIEYVCLSDPDFEFSHLMRIK